VLRVLVRKIGTRSIVVGRVLTANGIPVEGASVEVLVRSPGKMDRIAMTDARGDFVIGLRKQAFFSALVRVRHPQFRTVRFKTNSAIILCKLSDPPGGERDSEGYRDGLSQ
jgi:carboxypeptidase family protein